MRFWDLVRLESNLESSPEQIFDGSVLNALPRWKFTPGTIQGVAVKTKDDSGRSWLMLGYSHWNLGKIKSAQEAMTRAVAFKHQKKAANRALKSLSLQN